MPSEVINEVPSLLLSSIKLILLAVGLIKNDRSLAKLAAVSLPVIRKEY